ncbi:MAG TPA: hypothetical protein PKC22_00100 [Rhodocyclaceae bacterium]|nr:hypothetical protein [Rhodocyclaceae bacterium]
MSNQIWLLPEIFERLWRDERNYLILESGQEIELGDQVLIEEGNAMGVRTGRALEARVTALSRAGEEGLPRDLMVIAVKPLLKRAR